jgi:hypothetical protein
MPTNPLWLEHTEKAAWDTVEALRTELERERQRLERLTRLHPAWPKIVERLDELKREHGIGSDDVAETVDRLSALLGEAVRKRDELERELHEERVKFERERMLAAPGLERREPARDLGPSVRWFARLLEQRRREASARATKPDAKDAQRFVAALEHKLDELVHARPSELFELAIDIGHLAMLLARCVRPKRK